jgi:hypothetical protein
MNWVQRIAGLFKKKTEVVIPQDFKGHLAPFASRPGIAALEKIVEQFEPDNLEDVFPVTHMFANGVCSREMSMPKGGIVVSRVHKNDCINVLSKGSVEVLTEDGTMRLTAPHKFVSRAGTKRVIVAYEDSVWSNFIRTDETDPEKILDVMTCGTFAEFERYQQLRLES